MFEGKPQGHSQHDTLRIPTYDEATSRPSSSQSFSQEPTIEEEEGRRLLSHSDVAHTYRPPTVESARSSVDFNSLLRASGSSSRSTSSDNLRREIEEMEIIEPSQQEVLSFGSTRFSKHLTMLTHTLSSLHLPHLPSWMPNFGRFVEHLPDFKSNWILVGRLFALVLVLSLAYLVFFSNLFRITRSGVGRNWIEPEALRNYVEDHIDGDNIKDHLKYLTSFAHMAGTRGGQVQANYVRAQFAKNLEDVGLERFDVFLNYPKDEAGTRRVAIVEPEELAWEALIEEDPVYPDDPRRSNTPVFHGHSKSGLVQGPLIYANYGSREDFDHLKAAGIDLNGSIALVRYNEQDRALKVRAASMAGARGCIIYSDPAEDGFTKGKEFPEGRYMPKDGVQRGSVALTAWRIGDPLTPGFPSLPTEMHRDPREGNPGLNSIPSIPLAWRDAQKLLQGLKGHGLHLEGDWGVGSVPDVEWWTGDSSSPVVQLKNELDEVERSPIYNVLGQITGIEQPEKRIIVGNHRDAWCFGAADPNGGTAVLLEVIRLFGELQSVGWRPLRTIQFASWDGEEYNLIGSTEHVEARIDGIRRDGFAYLNMDVAVVGPDFRAASSPLLESIMLHVLERVTDPNTNKTVRDIFNEKNTVVEGLDVGSDHAAFQMLGGCSSLDFGFDGPPYPYHSCSDNFEWMERFGDPGFKYHEAAARIMILLILELADREILPFDFQIYADAMHREVENLETYTNPSHYLDYSALHSAAQELAKSAKEFHAWSQEWSNAVYGAGGAFESNVMAAKRISHNTRMANFETNLLDVDGGLPGREQYKHIFIGPQRWNGYATSYFPGIRDAIEDNNWKLAQEQIGKAAGIVSYAAKKLLH